LHQANARRLIFAQEDVPACIEQRLIQVLGGDPQDLGKLACGQQRAAQVVQPYEELCTPV
jgi:hypothetical protein